MPRGDHHEGDRVNRQQRSRGKQRALHTLLPAAIDERVDVRVVTELGLVDTALVTDRQLLADLGDDHTDLTGGYLHPRELLHTEDRPQLEPQTRHQELRLVTRLALEGDRVVVCELAEPEPLGHQPDLGRADRLDRFQQTDSNQNHDDSDKCQYDDHVLPLPAPRAVSSCSRSATWGYRAKPAPCDGICRI